MSRPEEVDISPELGQRAWECIRRSLKAACYAYARGDREQALKIGQSLLAQNIATWDAIDPRTVNAKRALLEELFTREIGAIVESVSKQDIEAGEPSIVLTEPEYTSKDSEASSQDSVRPARGRNRIPIDDICGMIDLLQGREYFQRNKDKLSKPLTLSA